MEGMEGTEDSQTAVLTHLGVSGTWRLAPGAPRNRPFNYGIGIQMARRFLIRVPVGSLSICLCPQSAVNRLCHHETKISDPIGVPEVQEVQNPESLNPLVAGQNGGI